MKKFISTSLAAVALGLSAQANTIIDTTPSNASIFSWGVPNTATYGETFTVPAVDNVLNVFTFGVNGVDPALQFKGYVFAWDQPNFRATGPALFTSAITQTSGSGSVNISFNTGGLSLISGNKYVMFASISEIDGQPSETGSWAARNSDVYSGGEFVFLNNGANESLWTQNTWSTWSPPELAFTAEFSAGNEAVPEVQTWASLAGFAMVGAEVLRRRKAAKA